MNRPRTTHPWRKGQTGIGDLPTRAELKAAADRERARRKTYDAVRRKFRIDNGLCTRCGRTLPADHKTRDCCSK